MAADFVMLLTCWNIFGEGEGVFIISNQLFILFTTIGQAAQLIMIWPGKKRN